MEMKAGRELDALVAEKVMGWQVHRDIARSNLPRFVRKPDGFDVVLPAFSTDIAAAWEMVEEVRVKKDFEMADAGDGGYIVAFNRGRGEDYHGHSDEPAHAICLAALKAVGA